MSEIISDYLIWNRNEKYYLFALSGDRTKTQLLRRDLIASAPRGPICMLSAQFAEESNMAMYQCFFFSGGRVSYWENIECDGSMSLTAGLRDRLKNGRWQHAEAWNAGKLVCDVRRRRSSDEGVSRLESSHSVLSLAD